MKRLIFDIETNGLLETLTHIHCLCTIDIDSGEVNSYSTLDGTLEEGLKTLTTADLLVGVNSVSFDVPAIDKVAKLGLGAKTSIQEHLDIQLFARLKFPDTTDRDYRAIGSGFPRELIGKHSLKAWGYRIGVIKGNYGETSNWETCTQEMVDYCLQDCRVTLALYNYLKPWEYSQEATQLEHDVKRYINEQELCGVPFDVQKARQLYKDVKAEYDSRWEAVKTMFPDKVETSTFVPKVNNKFRGYIKGVPVEKTTTTPFNPGSRQQLIDYFKTKYDWKPVDFTEKGSPEIGYDVLIKMPYQEAQVIAELFDMKKLMGMLFDGDNGWIKKAREGRVHGGVITNGAISGRMTHFSPNIAQVPNAKAYKGKECRDLFWSGSEEMEFVDADASALELRLFAHFLSRWDDGEYINTVINGDVHTENMKAFGLTDRNKAKTLIFAMLYGCGPAKAGSIIDATLSDERARIVGKELITNFKRARPAYAKLVNTVYEILDSRGFLLGFDGRKLIPRSKHAGLNTLIQGSGAILMKKATVLFSPKLKEVGGYPALHIHDAISCIVPKGRGDETGKAIVNSITEAGLIYNVKTPMTGAYGVGRTWGDSHA